MKTADKRWLRPTTAAAVASTSVDTESFGRATRDWQHELQRLTSREAFASCVSERPRLMRDRLDDAGQCDAYLAAYVEWLCERHGVAAPAWVAETERCADRAWYDYPPLWTDAFVHAPGPFRRRGVFTRPEDVLHFRRGRPRVSEAQKRQNNAARQRRHRKRIQEKLLRLQAFEGCRLPIAAPTKNCKP